MWMSRSLAAYAKEYCKEAEHAAHSKVSASRIWSVRDGDDIKPWRMTYCLESRDAGFDKKTGDASTACEEVEFGKLARVCLKGMRTSSRQGWRSASTATLKRLTPYRSSIKRGEVTL